MNATASETVCLIKTCLARRVGESRFQTWFGDDTDLLLDDDQLEVVVRNEFVGNWIAKNHLAQIKEAAHEVLGQEPRVCIHVRETPRPEALRSGPPLAGPPAPRAVRTRPALRGRLDSFVVGPANQLAYAAAQQIIDEPARACRLVVLHGACGLGKTHLLQAICNGVSDRHAGASWCYTSGEEFTNEYIQAIKNRRTEQFRAKYRSVDLLVIDDIQFLANKRATQEEFLYTFNTVEANGSLIVLSSDRHPRSIATLGDPLISRLISGMVLEVQPPDLATRREILLRRARKMAAPIGDAVLDFVARHITRNVRELEGALYRLAAMSALTREPLTVDLARLMLDDQLLRARPTPDIADIERICSNHFGVSVAQMRSKSRGRTICLARAVSFYLMRKHTNLSFPEIARAVGLKNHSTVVMATHRIEQQAQANQPLEWMNGAEPREQPIAEALAALEREVQRAVAGT